MRPSPRNAPTQMVRSRISSSANSARRRAKNASSRLWWSSAKRSANFDRELLPGGVVVAHLVLGDLRVELLGDALFHHRRCPEVEAREAAVDLRDPHPGDLALAHRQLAVLVRGFGQLDDTLGHLGAQLPHLHGVAARPVRNVDLRHERPPVGGASVGCAHTRVSRARSRGRCPAIGRATTRPRPGQRRTHGSAARRSARGDRRGRTRRPMCPGGTGTRRRTARRG